MDRSRLRRAVAAVNSAMHCGAGNVHLCRPKLWTPASNAGQMSQDTPFARKPVRVKDVSRDSLDRKGAISGWFLSRCSFRIPTKCSSRSSFKLLICPNPACTSSVRQDTLRRVKWTNALKLLDKLAYMLSAVALGKSVSSLQRTIQVQQPWDASQGPQQESPSLTVTSRKFELLQISQPA